MPEILRVICNSAMCYFGYTYRTAASRMSNNAKLFSDAMLALFIEYFAFHTQLDRCCILRAFSRITSSAKEAIKAFGRIVWAEAGIVGHLAVITSLCCGNGRTGSDLVAPASKVRVISPAHAVYFVI